MKNYLALDTTNADMTVVLKYNGKYFKYKETRSSLKHGSVFMTATESLLTESGADVKDMDFFACATGAGSFTGIRIGISAIKAFCFAENKPFLAVTSFDTIAYNDVRGKQLAVIDAKHGAYYVCGYDNGKVVIPPSYMTKEELLAVKGYKIKSFEDLGLGEEKVDACQGFINAIEEKENELSFDTGDLKPEYVRKSQAEEGR